MLMNFQVFLITGLHTSSDSIVASGSRSTTLALNQHCMAHDVTLIECKDIAEQLAKIGQGRFGEVTKGAFHGENAAITITRIRDEASWQNEVHVCTNIALYYENVLCFKGSAFTTRNDSTEIWLLTASHEQGSLYVYLLENTVTVNETVEFVRSICSGLLHLHAEMFGSKGKPAIAHRDLKHLTALAILLKEYWHKIPEVRPTVCRVKEALDKINADMEKLESVV
ncbi:unnamed protein product [Larinioides sclopetarius]|uniref:receptor protein serine/threonine kinase n=1 Tax=Larinioides sclopetarius TaxID=280406 RepID=A0AAV1ZLF3_9ARAC